VLCQHQTQHPDAAVVVAGDFNASLPLFGKSDHAAIFLLPEYKHRIVQEAVVMSGMDWDTIVPALR